MQRAAHIGVDELHPLRVAGRAGGVKLNDIVVRLAICAGMCVRLGIAPIGKPRPVGMVEIHGDDAAYLRAIVDNFFN